MEKGRKVKMKEVSYDKEFDILALHKGFGKGEKFQGNLDVGDLILDISTKGNIRGVEILNVSEFLGDYGITKEILKNLVTARFNTVIRPSGITLSLFFLAKNRKQEIPAKIAIAVPVNFCA
ncbi:MAG: DUF2283 domain-containing protein [Nanoarchaeota archaeon]